MELYEILASNPNCKIFPVLDAGEDGFVNCDIEISNDEIVDFKEDIEYFIIKAFYIKADGTIQECYMDLDLPERIGEQIIFLNNNEIEIKYSYELDGEIISAVPINYFGNYELFYSKTKPEIGINILKDGLKTHPNNNYIAEDLGYILRDEERLEEAAKAFQISADNEPTSHFIYSELADCYKNIGQSDLGDKYQKMFEAEESEA